MKVKRKIKKAAIAYCCRYDNWTWDCTTMMASYNSTTAARQQHGDDTIGWLNVNGRFVDNDEMTMTSLGVGANATLLLGASRWSTRCYMHDG